MISTVALGVVGGALFAGLRVIREKTEAGSKPPLWLTQETGDRSPEGAAAVATDGGTDGGTSLENVRAAGQSWIRTVAGDEQNRTRSIVGLTSGTALIHLALGFQFGMPIYILNAAGFGALLAARYATPQLEPHKELVDDAFIAFTGTTTAAYFIVQGAAGLAYPLGVATKVIEVGLIGLLWVDAQFLAIEKSKSIESESTASESVRIEEVGQTPAYQTASVAQ